MLRWQPRSPHGKRGWHHCRGWRHRLLLRRRYGTGSLAAPGCGKPAIPRRSRLGGRSGTTQCYGAGRRARAWRRQWHCWWWRCNTRQVRRTKPQRYCPPVVTIAAFLAEELPDGGLLLRAVTPVAVAVGKDLELWALPPGATRPISLGVIPAAAQRLAVPHPDVRLAQRTQLMVSLEPKGGSPTGQPTGQVLFAGTLTN